MPQFCLLFYAILQSWRPKGRGHGTMAPPNTPLHGCRLPTFDHGGFKNFILAISMALIEKNGLNSAKRAKSMNRIRITFSIQTRYLKICWLAFFSNLFRP